MTTAKRAGGLHIKCYLFPNDVTPSTRKMNTANEIRRFQLRESDTRGLYHSLIDSIFLTYKDYLLHGDEIKTYWLDDDHDLVGFSSEQEMSLAVEMTRRTCLTSSPELEDLDLNELTQEKSSKKQLVFRVYISKVRSGGTPIQSEKEMLVPKVEAMNGTYHCMACRTKPADFKCSVCPNYLICDQCRYQGVHLEHLFHKIYLVKRGERP